MPDVVCSKCGEAKAAIDYASRPANKSGRSGQCRSCEAKYTAAYRRKAFAENPELYRRHLESAKKNRAKRMASDPDTERMRARVAKKKRYREIKKDAEAYRSFREKHISDTSAWRRLNPELDKAQRARQRAKYHEKARALKSERLAAKQAYAEAHPAETAAAEAARKMAEQRAAKVYRAADHARHIAIYGVSRATLMRRARPQYMIRARLNARLQKALRRRGKWNSGGGGVSLAMIGCTVNELCLHIERQFVLGMRWETRHLWHVDHIRPCNTFDLTDPAQAAACFHYTNLRPLWAEHNLKRPKDGSDISALDDSGVLGDLGRLAAWCGESQRRDDDV